MNNPIEKLIFDTVDDLVTCFLYNDRRDDEELSADDIENAIKAGVVTVDQIVARFNYSLLHNLEL